MGLHGGQEKTMLRDFNVELFQSNAAIHSLGYLLQPLSGSSCSSGLDWWKFISQRHRPRCGKPCDQPGMRYLNVKQWDMCTCDADSLVHWTFSNRMATNMRSCVDMTSTRQFGFAGHKCMQRWAQIATRSWWFPCFCCRLSPCQINIAFSFIQPPDSFFNIMSIFHTKEMDWH